jgi:hypothetical protein
MELKSASMEQQAVGSHSRYSDLTPNAPTIPFLWAVLRVSVFQIASTSFQMAIERLGDRLGHQLKLNLCKILEDLEDLTTEIETWIPNLSLNQPNEVQCAVTEAIGFVKSVMKNQDSSLTTLLLYEFFDATALRSFPNESSSSTFTIKNLVLCFQTHRDLLSDSEVLKRFASLIYVWYHLSRMTQYSKKEGSDLEGSLKDISSARARNKSLLSSRSIAIVGDMEDRYDLDRILTEMFRFVREITPPIAILRKLATNSTSSFEEESGGRWRKSLLCFVLDLTQTALANQYIGVEMLFQSFLPGVLATAEFLVESTDKVQLFHTSLQDASSNPLFDTEDCPAELMCEVWCRLLELVTRAVANNISYNALASVILVNLLNLVDSKIQSTWNQEESLAKRPIERATLILRALEFGCNAVSGRLTHYFLGEVLSIISRTPSKLLLQVPQESKSNSTNSSTSNFHSKDSPIEPQQITENPELQLLIKLLELGRLFMKSTRYSGVCSSTEVGYASHLFRSLIPRSFEVLNTWVMSRSQRASLYARVFDLSQYLIQVCFQKIFFYF